MRRAAALIAAGLAILAFAALGVGASAAATGPVSASVVLTVTQSGGAVTLTATVTGTAGAPAGSVQFDQNDSRGQVAIGADQHVGDSDGPVATVVTTTLLPGTYSITATFTPDDIVFGPYTTSTSSAQIVVVASLSPLASTSVALTGGSSTSAVQTLTAAVARTGGAPGTPGGTVTFYDNDVPLAAPVLLESGVATLPFAFTPGAHVVTAAYSGDSADRPSASTSPLTLNIAGADPSLQTTTTVTATPAAIYAGVHVQLAAHVAQVAASGVTVRPLGNYVIFYANGTRLGQSPVDEATGDSLLGVDGWLAGEYTITASYIGSVGNQASAGQTSVGVAALPAGGLPNLTVTAPSPAMTYGGPLPALVPSYTGNRAGVPVPPVTCSTSATAASHVGTTYPVSCAGPAADPNYASITYVAGTLSVTPAHLTVAPVDVTTPAGTIPSSFATTLTGFVNGDGPGVVTGRAACSTTATASSAPGAYPIACVQGTLAARDYDFTNFPTGTLTVLPLAPPVICARPVAHNDSGDHDRGKGSPCESLLSQPSHGADAKVKPGESMSIVYMDDTDIGPGTIAVLNGSVPLPVTIKAIARAPKRYQYLLTFAAPATPGTIVLTVHDSDGHLDQWIWQVSSAKK
jgi:hypothetical protein